MKNERNGWAYTEVELDNRILSKHGDRNIERYLLVNLPYYKRCVWVRGGPSKEKK